MKSENFPSTPANPEGWPAHTRRLPGWASLLLVAVLLLPATIALKTDKHASIPQPGQEGSSVALSASVATAADAADAADTATTQAVADAPASEWVTPEGASAAAGEAAQGTLAQRRERILIKPKGGADPADIEKLHAANTTSVWRSFDQIGGLQVVELPPGLTVAQAVDTYRNSGLVEYAEPDAMVHALAEPNDFRYWDQSLWNLHNTGIFGGKVGADIHAPEAWDIRTDASNIVVAVIDTGVRVTHEDLVPNIWTNPGETGLDSHGASKATNGVDDDGDGFVDDVHGINAITETGNPADDFGHGTHVAGIIGAVGNNTVGVTGVAWRVQIMALKFLDSAGNGTVSDAIECINYARVHGAKVISASWGDYSFTSNALRDAINGLRPGGTIFVAAAGNSSGDNDTNPLFPASYEFDNIISVSATDRTDAPTAYSNYGHTTVDLSAPGDPVFSAWNGSDTDYRYCFGTSMAVPNVTGAVALLMAEYPTESVTQIIHRIVSTADPLPALAGKSVSGGRLNVAAAIKLGRAPSAVASRLGALSVRTFAGSGDDTLIAGVVMGGTSGKRIIFRGVSSTLPAMGIANALSDPQLSMFSGSAQIDGNDNWGGSATMAQQFASVGLSPLAANSKDAAMVPTVAPGVYSVQMSNTSGPSGIALMELYDGDPSNTNSGMSGISVRSFTGTGGDVLIVGVVVNGSSPAKVVIRAVGPSMGASVPTRIADPIIRLFSGSSMIQSNDDWGGGSELSSAFTSVGLAPLPANSKDAALIATLSPGVYTIQVSGVGNSTGVALVEMYEMH